MASVKSPRDLVRSAVTAFLANPQDKAGLKPLALKFGALPVYADMGGALLIGTDGQVLRVDSDQPWNSEAEAIEETDMTWIEVAYDRCWVKYSELRPVLSARGFSK